jgi:hypothetical protein
LPLPTSAASSVHNVGSLTSKLPSIRCYKTQNLLVDWAQHQQQSLTLVSLTSWL